MSNYVILDLNDLNITEKQLIEAISENTKKAITINTMIKKLQDASIIETKDEKRENNDEQTSTEINRQEEIDEAFEDEVEYYLTELNQLEKDNIEKEISGVLPSHLNYNYKKILLRLQAESLKNIKEIKELIKEEKENLTTEDLTYLYKDISFETKKISLIGKRLEKKEENENPEEFSNNLVFVPTPSGNIRIIEDIKHLAPEYYDGFKGLLDSIKNGTFKNVKRFNSYYEFNGICEVKDSLIRILFARLNKDTYAIISAFTKKCQSDKAYWTMLVNRTTDYRVCSEKLKENLLNEEFIKEQSNIEKNLYTILETGDTKGNQYQKKGN